MWGLFSNHWVMIGIGFQIGIAITWIPKRKDKLYHQLNIYLPFIELYFFF